MESLIIKNRFRVLISLFFLLSGSYDLIAQHELQKLIDNTMDGGTVTFRPGRYVIDQPLRIDDRKNLTVRGQGDCKILLTDLWEDVLTVNNSNSILIQGLYLSHLKPLPEYQCNGGVISLTYSEKISIESCELEGSGTIGVQGSDITNLTISGCHIHDNTFNAFYLRNINGALIEDCVIENNANMMQSYSLDGFQMSDNLIRNNGGYWNEKKPDKTETPQVVEEFPGSSHIVTIKNCMLGKWEREGEEGRLQVDKYDARFVDRKGRHYTGKWDVYPIKRVYVFAIIQSNGKRKILKFVEVPDKTVDSVTFDLGVFRRVK